ncbi:MAG: radical SAM protein [Bacteroidales bacterium]|nr:radical SAM protein [Bacteroidales bacterium]
MATFLFDNIIFGPVKSRRLGNSLGVNLLPVNAKFCSFNCVYCECGWNSKGVKIELPRLGDIVPVMEKYFSENKQPLDVITFAGNGEPTINPDFPEIVAETVRLRDKYLPNVKISVLTNASNLGNEKVVSALKMIDEPILKVDTFIQSDFELINQPASGLSIATIVDNIAGNFEHPIIQTMFLRGNINGTFFDNTTDESLRVYFETLKRLNPSQVMVYSIARETPLSGLQPVAPDALENIGAKIRSLGFNVLVTP